MDVRRLSGITPDALRKIESGDVLPRYDTLIYLSNVYKVDLFDILKSYSSFAILFDYYSRLDDLIISYDLEKLRKLDEDFSNALNSSSQDLKSEVKTLNQFKEMLSGISKYNSEEPSTSLESFISAMAFTNPLFSIDNFRELKYSVLEQRLLLLIALAIANKGQLLSSNSMLEFLLQKSNFDNKASLNEKLLIIKLYFNLSYNCHRLKLHPKAFEYAQAGIDYCNKNYLSYALAGLLYRRGIAEFFIKNPNYQRTLEQSIILLMINNQESLAKQYAEIAFKSYSIKIPNILLSL